MCRKTRRDTMSSMTTLVGIQGDDFLLMAADSQITDGDQRIISIETPKIVTTGKYLLGITGDSRPGDILAYAWKPPLYKGENPTKFMGSKVLPSISAAFKEGNYEVDNKEMNFSFLLGFNGNLFSIGGDVLISKMDAICTAFSATTLAVRTLL